LAIEVINSIDITSKFIVLCTNRGAYLAKENQNSTIVSSWIKTDDREIQNSFNVNGKLYLLGSGSIIGVHEANNKALREQILFRSKGLKLDDSFLPPAKHYSIAHKHENLHFIFERITYSGNVPNLRFELKGKVLQSGSGKSNEIELSRLPVGSYSLAVYPEIVDGENKKIDISFVIEPEWHETWMARLSMIVIFILLLVGLVITLIKRNRKEIQKQNEQEQLLLEYKLIALKAQVNPHFISNCLTAIQNLIAKGENEKANLYVAKFGLLVRKILDYSSMSLITLEEELLVVRLYIQMEEVRFGKVFDFNVNVYNEIDLSDSLVPSLLLNPIIENAIWHGLLPLAKNEQAKLEISIGKENKTLKITILDNGVGISEKKQTDETRKSYGLEITQQRIKNINYLLQSEVGKVDIKNRYNQDGTLLGVEVLLCLPIENKY
jgi:hypothetical protein